jgi:hypothetical protein
MGGIMPARAGAALVVRVGYGLSTVGVWLKNIRQMPFSEGRRIEIDNAGQRI